jgi:hypothetical protein
MLQTLGDVNFDETVLLVNSYNHNVHSKYLRKITAYGEHTELHLTCILEIIIGNIYCATKLRSALKRV